MRERAAEEPNFRPGTRRGIGRQRVRHAERIREVRDGERIPIG